MKNKILKIINIDFIYWGIILVNVILEIKSNWEFDSSTVDFSTLGIQEYLVLFSGILFSFLFV